MTFWFIRFKLLSNYKCLMSNNFLSRYQKFIKMVKAKFLILKSSFPLSWACEVKSALWNWTQVTFYVGLSNSDHDYLLSRNYRKNIIQITNRVFNQMLLRCLRIFSFHSRYTQIFINMHTSTSESSLIIVASLLKLV